MDHFWIDMEDDAGKVASAGGKDDPRIDLQRFVVYRVRFGILNDGADTALVEPRLLVGSGAAPATFSLVPELRNDGGHPFYVAADKGPVRQERVLQIAASDMELPAAERDGITVPGTYSAGQNPPGRIRVPAGAYTEVVFAVRATVDAAWEHAYSFRLDLGTPMASRVDALVSMGVSPPVELTPGQRNGVRVGEPLPAYPLKLPTGSIQASLAVAVMPNPNQVQLNAASYTSPHMDYDLATDKCATCHKSHTAQGANLITTSSPISQLCFRCHDGTGANANIQAQYTSPAPPADDPTNSAYYSHPATTASTHTADSADEFQAVSNRHAECVDCHQPHRSDATLSTMTTAGWKVGGALLGSSGLKVVNGAANTAPAYTWQRTNTYEYELCLKCHSGYTTLRAQRAGYPSQWALDKGIEFNPANGSYHPVEAAGKNATSQMTGSLSGTSPYKLWTFTTTSLVRCQNCHGQSSATNPAPDAQLDNHTSANRGILLRNYRDRVLRLRNQTPDYDAADFALCYLCHAEAPMRDVSGDSRSDTNFRFHGLHVSGIGSQGSSTVTAIDTAGAGSGNAICAECHFRIHGSSFPAGTQTLPGSRLVNFSPNTTGTRTFVQRDGATSGSCTITCHGMNHSPENY